MSIILLRKVVVSAGRRILHLIMLQRWIQLCIFGSLPVRRFFNFFLQIFLIIYKFTILKKTFYDQLWKISAGKLMFFMKIIKTENPV